MLVNWKNSIFIQLKTSISGSQLRTLQSFEPCPTETADRHRRLVPHRPRRFLVRIHGSFGSNIFIRIMIMKQWIFVAWTWWISSSNMFFFLISDNELRFCSICWMKIHKTNTIILLVHFVLTSELLVKNRLIDLIISDSEVALMQKSGLWGGRRFI